MEEDEHDTDVCVNGFNPTEFDLDLTHDVIWKLDGQVGMMRNFGLTEDVTMILLFTVNPLNAEILKPPENQHYPPNFSVSVTNSLRTHMLATKTMSIA